MIEGVHGIHQYQFSKTESQKQTVEQAYNDHNSEIECSQTTDSDLESVTYDKKDFLPENREELLSKMFKSMSNISGLEKIRQAVDEKSCYEIYSTRIKDGKLCISGGEGYHHKAKAYEKLVNASMNSIWNRKTNAPLAKETDILNQADDLLKYYMGIDNDIRKADKNDSIANHIDDAFLKWQSENQPKRHHFDGRI